jgi:hypothetical protein
MPSWDSALCAAATGGAKTANSVPNSSKEISLRIILLLP